MSHDWIKPGAPIAVYQNGREGKQRLRLTTVRTVASKSFTVEGYGDRFKLETMSTKSSGGLWSTRYIATHPDSEDAAAAAAKDNRLSLRSDVWPYLANQCESLEHVDEAIQALRKWRAVLVKESGGAA